VLDSWLNERVHLCRHNVDLRRVCHQVWLTGDVAERFKALSVLENLTHLTTLIGQVCDDSPLAIHELAIEVENLLILRRETWRRREGLPMHFEDNLRRRTVFFAVGITRVQAHVRRIDIHGWVRDL